MLGKLHTKGCVLLLQDIEDALDEDIVAVRVYQPDQLPVLHSSASTSSKPKAAKGRKPTSARSGSARGAASKASSQPRARGKGPVDTENEATTHDNTAHHEPPVAAIRSRRAAARAVKPGVYKDRTKFTESGDESDGDPVENSRREVLPSAASLVTSQRRSKQLETGGSEDEGSAGIQPTVSNASTASKRKREHRKHGTAGAVIDESGNRSAAKQVTQSASITSLEKSVITAGDSDSGDESDASCARSRKYQKPGRKVSGKSAGLPKSSGIKPMSAKDLLKIVKLENGAAKASGKTTYLTQKLSTRRGAAGARQNVKSGVKAAASTDSLENRNTQNVQSLVKGFETMAVVSKITGVKVEKTEVLNSRARSQ